MRQAATSIAVYHQDIEPERGLQIEVIQVPRVTFTESLWSRPFSEIRAMAVRGECGMSLLDVPSIQRNLLGDGKCLYQLRHVRANGPDELETVRLPEDMAYLRAGAGLDKRPDQAFLYAQNW